MSDELKVAIEAAKKGAKHALKYFNKDVKVKVKPDNSIVTQVDEETEEVIKSFILKSFPRAKFVGEETGGSLREKEFWTIDPVDGTRSFVRGLSTWTVLIGFVRGNKVVLGVCYFPVLKNIVWAERGKGAFVDGKRAHVSKIDDIKNAYVDFGSLNRFRVKEPLLRLADKSGSIRSQDEAFSSWLLVEGKMDVVIDPYGQVWDYAPFKVIIEEAGGRVTNMKGKEWDFTDQDFVATNGLLHDEVIRILHEK